MQDNTIISIPIKFVVKPFDDKSSDHYSKISCWFLAYITITQWYKVKLHIICIYTVKHKKNIKKNGQQKSVAR